MFRPEAARLCWFFELSSLTLSLAPRGGFQSKAGFVKMVGPKASKRANQPGPSPTSWPLWYHRREPKWFIVKESYIVFTEGPESVSGGPGRFLFI
jgi:phospholipase D1/2